MNLLFFLLLIITNFHIEFYECMLIDDCYSFKVRFLIFIKTLSIIH